MPELPEVETIVRDLLKLGLCGRRIVRGSVSWARTLEGRSPTSFRRLTRDLTVEVVRRRGKFIVIELSDGFFLLIHLRMTGQLRFCSPGEPRTRHDHVAFLLDDGRELRFRDTRKFGRVALLRDPERRLSRLGPEPLATGFTASLFVRRLRRHHRMLKPLLLDQSFLAGLGNIYVDEALFDAGLHPTVKSDTLDDAAASRLHRSIRKVLRRGIAALGTTLGNGSTNFYSVSGRRGRNKDGLRVFRRTGMPCPRCGTRIVRLTVGQRGTHVCPACQPLPLSGKHLPEK